MELQITQFSSYDIFGLEGDLRIADIPVLSPELMRHVQNNPEKNIVLDLSRTTTMDSSAIRLLINLRKRVEGAGKTVYLLKPSEAILDLITTTHLDQCFTVINNLDQPSSQQFLETIARYSSHTQLEKHGLRRLVCTCSVCGSDRVVGYLINPTDYLWRWDSEDPFPSSFTRSGKPVEIPSLFPIVCLECLMTSLNPSHFHAGQPGANAISSTLDEHSKLLLSKGIKARKKLVETENLIVGEDSLRHPRDVQTTYSAYKLAEVCAHTMAVNRVSASAFTVGYIAYLTIKYAEPGRREELINSCRTWMTQVVAEKARYSQTEQAQANFILFNAALHLGKLKEATSAQLELSTLVQSTEESREPGFDNPYFWHQQAKSIWQREIQLRLSEVTPKIDSLRK